MDYYMHLNLTECQHTITFRGITAASRLQDGKSPYKSGLSGFVCLFTNFCILYFINYFVKVQQ